MNKKITIITASLLVGFGLLMTNGETLIANNGGPGGGNSSSGGDSGSSCGQGGCHGGGHIAGNSYIVTDIPAGGYVPGTEYNVTLSGSDRGKSKFGFEFAAEDASNATAGTLAPGASPVAREQLRGNGHLVHTASGTTGTAGSFGWQFKWTAPSAGTGSVTFSTAVLFANGNGNNGGDSTRISSLTVNEDLSVGLNELTKLEVKTYPNPVVNELNISLEKADNGVINIFDASGKSVKNININSNTLLVDVSDLIAGNYVLQVSQNGLIHNEILIKK